MAMVRNEVKEETRAEACSGGRRVDMGATRRGGVRLDRSRGAG